MVKTHIEVYKDKQGKSRWRMLRNGRILADGGEGYNKLSVCRKSLARLIGSFAKGDYEITVLPPVKKT